jgi:hypothetical protein
MAKKTSKLTAKPRKSAISSPSKKAASKAARKKTEELEDRRKLMELTLKGFQMTYEAYQQGKFHRIL